MNLLMQRFFECPGRKRFGETWHRCPEIYFLALIDKYNVAISEKSGKTYIFSMNILFCSKTLKCQISQLLIRALWKFSLLIISLLFLNLTFSKAMFLSVYSIILTGLKGQAEAPKLRKTVVLDTSDVFYKISFHCYLHIWLHLKINKLILFYLSYIHVYILSTQIYNVR